MHRFDTLLADGVASVRLRDAAMLGQAYAHYWAGNHDAAAGAFRTMAVTNPTSPLVDDAQYGDARARWEAGDRAGAVEVLRRLAGARPDGTRPRQSIAALLSLEPRAVMRATFQRYRRLPLRPPGDQVVPLLDGDGKALARAALRRIEFDAPGETAPAGARALRRTAAQPGAPAAIATTAHGLPSRAAAERRTGLPIMPLVLLALLAAAVAVALLNRHPSKPRLGGGRPT
jgi:hypothetical protein